MGARVQLCTRGTPLPNPVSRSQGGPRCLKRDTELLCKLERIGAVRIACSHRSLPRGGGRSDYAAWLPANFAATPS